MPTAKYRATRRRKTGQDSMFLRVDHLPCDGQTTDSIYGWAQNLTVGSSVILRESMSHTLFEYRFGKVEAITDGGRRVLVAGVGTFWRIPKFAGKNCFAPSGQRTMIEPTSATKKAARSGFIYISK